MLNDIFILRACSRNFQFCRLIHKIRSLEIRQDSIVNSCTHSQLQKLDVRIQEESYDSQKTFISQSNERSCHKLTLHCMKCVNIITNTGSGRHSCTKHANLDSPYFKIWQTIHMMVLAELLCISITSCNVIILQPSKIISLKIPLHHRHHF